MVSLSDAKANLSRHVERVRHGESIRIQIRGVPVAELVPIVDRAHNDIDAAELQELERAGLIRQGRGALPAAILKPGPAVRGKQITTALLDERRSAR